MQGASFLALNLPGRLDVSNANLKIAQDLLFPLCDFAEFLNNQEHLLWTLGVQCGSAEFSPSPPTSYRHNESHLQPAADLHHVA